MKSALITGISGQDGSYMADYLLGLGYKVTGTLRKNPSCVPWLQALLGNVEFLYADMRDSASLEAAINKADPDEIYNFAAYDGIPLSWNHPEECMDVIYGGLSRLLGVVKRLKPEARVYQASSAAMFGDFDGPCKEDTFCRPNSPYAVAKHAAHELAAMWRSCGLFVSCGICLNHESERRSTDRASTKIAAAVARWGLGYNDKLMFGNQDSLRDWGYSKDFCVAFHTMLQQERAGDFVIGTGKANSVRAFIQACCFAAGMGNIPDHLIVTDARFVRQNDTKVMVANPTKAKEELGWEAKTTMSQLAGIMVTAEMEKVRARAKAART